jgi:CRISPR-associated protein Cas2
MRRAFLVSYDIRDPKRLRHTHRAIKAFGCAWQYSVFYCVLKDIDRVRLQAKMESILDLKADQLLIIDLGPAKGTDNEEAARDAVTTIGQALPEPESGYVVI